MRLIFGREPAVAVEMLGSVALALLLLVPMDDAVRGTANAAVLALAGFVTALLVSADKALPALTGVIKAAFALVLALGVDLPDATQVGILAVVSAVGAFFVRQQVVAPVPQSATGRAYGQHAAGEWGGGPTPAGDPDL